jgi:hypothetical protein
MANAQTVTAYIDIKVVSLPTEGVNPDGTTVPLGAIACLNLERGLKDDGSDMGFYAPLQSCPPKGVPGVVRDTTVKPGERWCYRAYVVTATNGTPSNIVCKPAITIVVKAKAPVLL